MNDTDPRWSEFVRWGERFREIDVWEEYERTYKIRAAEAVASARAELLSGGEWQSALARALRHKDQNIVSWRAVSRFLSWVRSSPDEAAAALRLIWAKEGDITTSTMDSALALIPRQKDVLPSQSERVTVLSYLLMAVDPYRFPPYRVTPFQDAWKLTGYPLPATSASDAEVYQHALSFLDEIVATGNDSGVTLRDRLDAQGVVWSITKWGAAESWSEAVQESFRRYLKGLPPPPKPQLADLAEELLLDADYLQTVRRLLDDKRQVIFFGPPGTGKTFVAQRLARFFCGDPDEDDDAGEVRLVQFHPSYAYEDFVEGYRPAREGGFELRQGPLKQLAEAAAHDPDVIHVLVIDEINRGNIAKVFGELYFLLEYRDEAVSLLYSDESFTLPTNLWIIGTMNTADRSIALLDTALRRRFHFVPFFPDQAPVQGLLRRWLERNKPELVWVADLVDTANERLGDRHAAIGPSHFMRETLDEEWVKLIWEHSVLPYIAEHFYGEEERVSEFELDALARVTTTAIDDVDAPADAS